MVIDFHTHLFPEKIAEKALHSLAHRSGGMTPCGDATPETMKKIINEQGVSKSVVLNIATNPRQQTNVNNFAISLLGSDCLVPFGSVHPDSENALQELERLKEAGIKGVKLHPDYQDFFVDDDKMLPIYEKIASLGLITVFHAGVDIGFANVVHCTPERLLRVLDSFGDAPVIAAHWGGYMLYNDVMNYLVGTKVYLDTSFSYSKYPPDYARNIIKEHSADKILFGTDMPWSSPKDELQFIDSLDIEETDKQKILFDNAESLLGL